MHKDMRDIVKNNQGEKATLSKNHRARFQDKLHKEFHKDEVKLKSKSYQWLYVAASIVILVGLGITFYPKSGGIEGSNQPPIVTTNTKENISEISLGSISPELKTIETYYTNTINYQLSQLELTKENKEVFDVYLAQLGELTKEYKSLTKELNTKGVNDDTINALIGNLQLRLQLLKRMQKQLQEFKNPNQNYEQTI
ncbi:hypothetical protein [Tenacibaculum sp. 190524A02b]|uniref:Anti-sigma factor n=1 Tax=Tenacibaculum vairaonense TaxID=3137860 RepID=A0ABP1FAW8_9FLAO